MNAVQVGKRIKLKNILYTTDFSPCSTAALPYALSVARRYGATLHAIHVLPSEAEMVFMWPEKWAAKAEEENMRVHSYVAELESQLKGLPHRILTPRGKVPDAVVDIVEACQIDLLILGTHGRTGTYKLVIGSVAEELFRRAACPVLSVGPKMSRKANDEAEFRHILFATDFTKASLSALPHAISLAEENEAQLTLVYIVEQPAAGTVGIENVTPSLLRRLRKLIPPEVEPWCHADCLIGFAPPGSFPANHILAVAEDKGADLIVLGVRATQGDLGLVTHLASTTAQILTDAACPVLTVCG